MNKRVKEMASPLCLFTFSLICFCSFKILFHSLLLLHSSYHYYPIFASVSLLSFFLSMFLVGWQTGKFLTNNYPTVALVQLHKRTFCFIHASSHCTRIFPKTKKRKGLKDKECSRNRRKSPRQKDQVG